nr:MAG TPA: hypothetical protein [Caudoviricetes sp.]
MRCKRNVFRCPAPVRGVLVFTYIYIMNLLLTF